MPEKLVLLSPWLDATANEPIQLELEKNDPLIAVSGLRSFGQQYAGELGLDDPGVSPLFGTHQKLPPIQMFAGTADVLLPDARRFQDKLTEVGGTLEYHEYEDMFHVWMLIAIPEGKRVMKQISAFMD
jgi:acetyl esterase/lipase